jgi:ribosomal biogenesis protein LAS1
MVQYVFTPWRDRRELLKVRQQFYPQQHDATGTVPSARQQQQQQPSKHHGTQHQPAQSTIPATSEPGPEGAQQQQQRDKHDAVARVSMWMQRGNCPHMVESTALLTAAILSDQSAARGAGGSWEQQQQQPSQGTGSASDSGSVLLLSSSSYAVRAAYSAAFSR